MHAYVAECAFTELHLYSKSSRQAGGQAGKQAGFWQGPELWNGLSLQFCRWLDQPIPLYLAEGSSNPTAAVPFCEILFHFTTLTDNKACAHTLCQPETPFLINLAKHRTARMPIRRFQMSRTRALSLMVENIITCMWDLIFFFYSPCPCAVTCIHTDTHTNTHVHVIYTDTQTQTP